MSISNEVSIFTDEDWAILLPANTVQVGTVLINVTPLTWKSFSEVSSKTIYIVKKMSREGMFKSISETSNNLDTIVPLLIKEAPEILKVLTGIPVIDLVRLPISKVLELVSSAFEINTRDQEALEKNLEGLAGILNMLTGGVRRVIDHDQAQTQIQD